jgi:hypothetical protein
MAAPLGSRGSAETPSSGAYIDHAQLLLERAKLRCMKATIGLKHGHPGHKRRFGADQTPKFSG